MRSSVLHWMISLFLLINISALGSSRIDSLKSQLTREKSDSVKFEILMELSRNFIRDIRGKEECEKYLGMALEIAEIDSSFNYMSRVYNSFGILYRNIAQYNLALINHHKAVKLAQKANNSYLLASAYNSIGVVYRRMDNHPEAAQFHLLGLKSAEEVKDTTNIAISLNSLGNIYSLNGQYAEAFKYFTGALSLAKAMNNILGQAINYNNIGEVYEFMGVYDSARVYYTKSLEANQRIGSKKGLAISYNALGKIHLYNGNTLEAKKLFDQALAIDLEIGDKKFIADSYINLGRVHTAMNNLRVAESNTLKGIETAKEIGSITHIQWAYEILGEIYKLRKDYKAALQFHDLATSYKDSILNEQNTRAIAMMEVMYQTEKKEQEIQLLLQSQELNEKELARQTASRNFYLAAFVFSLIMLITVLYALKIKRKANEVLLMQKNQIEQSHSVLTKQQEEIIKKNKEIEFQRNSIEQKNKNLEDAYHVIEGYMAKITDSIRYAERIQKAILPPLAQTASFFTDSFCFYKPKDFVSGDFYWLNVKDNVMHLAVADCTGHGVPGAFMSIIGMDLLNQAINQSSITSPSKLLDYLNVELRNKLRVETEEELILKDSMDVAIVSMQRGEKVLTYSSALIPLTIVREQKIIEFKPQFTSIGISSKLFKKPFKEEIIDLMPGDWVYLYSDGFIDQFGGGQNKKFMRSQFFDSLIKINGLRGKDQKDELERIFSSWRNKSEQIDDVLVLGLKV
jgi:serine phosphatase RsbU (regulator of sigma subunit)